jgi:hypothetical protein
MLGAILAYLVHEIPFPSSLVHTSAVVSARFLLRYEPVPVGVPERVLEFIAASELSS